MQNLPADFFPVETISPEETLQLGARLSSFLEPGDVVALVGHLGAGKTQFVKGICHGFGISPSRVLSPTFTIVHEYDGDELVYHIDLYRIKTLVEAQELGLDEILNGEGIVCIEWPEVVGSLLTDEALLLQIEHRDGNRRRYTRFSARAAT